MTPEELKKIARDDRAYRNACQLLSDHIQLSYQEAINTMLHASF